MPENEEPNHEIIHKDPRQRTERKRAHPGNSSRKKILKPKIKVEIME